MGNIFSLENIVTNAYLYVHSLATMLDVFMHYNFCWVYRANSWVYCANSWVYCANSWVYCAHENVQGGCTMYIHIQLTLRMLGSLLSMFCVLCDIEYVQGMLLFSGPGVLCTALGVLCSFIGILCTMLCCTTLLTHGVSCTMYAGCMYERIVHCSGCMHYAGFILHHVGRMY